MSVLGRASFFLLAGALLFGCDSSFDTTLSVTFPSANAAITTDTLDISVYAVSRDDACEDIFERRRTNQTLPPPVTETGAVRTCDLFNGRAPKLEVGFGTRAFLVVGKRRDEEIVMGCEVHFVDDRTPPPLVRLTLFDGSKAIPLTMCPSMVDRCAGRCM